MNKKQVLDKIEREMARCGTAADDGSHASGYQRGLKDGLRMAGNIVLNSLTELD